jgi:hypothetical protein
VKHVDVEEEVRRLGCLGLRRGMLAKVSVRLVDASDELAITHRMDSLDLLERQPVEPLKLRDVAALELANELRVGREQVASDRAAVKGPSNGRAPSRRLISSEGPRSTSCGVADSAEPSAATPRWR